MTAAVPAFDYFEHDADIGIRGHGRSVEEAFVNGARAMFALMVEAGAKAGKPEPEPVAVTFSESDLDLAFVRWLNGLITEARIRGLALGDFTLTRDGERWAGSARGYRPVPGGQLGIEVKGATLTMLSVTERDGEWQARCVVDV